MKEPIKAGDLAEVINGYRGKNSPNLGLIVKVKARVYECPQLGIIWRCESEYGQRDRDDRQEVPPGQLDFAQDWLRKIEPPEQTTGTSTAKDRNLVA